MLVEKPDRAAAIIRDAGGRVVGRTRLQKIGYLLDAAGYGDNFQFVYKHYGPFSEALADSATLGCLLGNIAEKKVPTKRGGTCSIYSLPSEMVSENIPPARKELASAAAKANTIVLELAATAVFLSKDDLSKNIYDDLWAEIKRRKPEKATPERIKEAKELLSRLQKLPVLKPLPKIA